MSCVALASLAIPTAWHLGGGRGGSERRVTSCIETKPWNGTIALAETNRQFSLTLHHWSVGDSRPLLLLEEFHREGWLHVDGGVGTVKVTAWTGDNANLKDKIWTIERDGYAGERLDRFYRITALERHVHDSVYL